MVNSIKAKNKKILKNEYINIDIISYSSKILVLFRFERF